MRGPHSSARLLEGANGSAKLLEQCRKAAETWLATVKANGRWKGKDREDFLRHSEGLGIKTDG
jgi:hypothetical protein